MARSSIEKIWVMGNQPDGYAGTSVLYKNKKKKRKKQLGLLKPFERSMRMGAKSGKEFFSTYERDHNKSNKKRKNGWVTDLPINMIKANNKAIRSFKLPRIIGM